MLLKGWELNRVNEILLSVICDYLDFVDRTEIVFEVNVRVRGNFLADVNILNLGGGMDLYSGWTDGAKEIQVLSKISIHYRGQRVLHDHPDESDKSIE